MQISRNKIKSEAKVLLKQIGLKATAPRLCIYEILKNSGSPVSADYIYGKSKKSADRASIYRTLNSFIKLGICDEVNLKEGFLRYELKNEDTHHHHIRCDNCGRIECIDICIKDEVEKITKFKINDHSIEFTGICPRCSKK